MPEAVVLSFLWLYAWPWVIAMKEISLAEAKDKLSELIREVQAGATVIITKHHKPAARLVSEDDYQRLQRASAVAGVRSLRRALRESGLAVAEIHEASRRELEERG